MDVYRKKRSEEIEEYKFRESGFVSWNVVYTKFRYPEKNENQLLERLEIERLEDSVEPFNMSDTILNNSKGISVCNVYNPVLGILKRKTEKLNIIRECISEDARSLLDKGLEYLKG